MALCVWFRRLPSILLSVLFLISCLLPGRVALADDDLFPIYDCLQPNVAFWEKVYSQYALSQGILHDSDNLDVVYQVIDLEGDDEPGAANHNREQVKEAKQKYHDILARLAAGESPRNEEERRVLGLFGDHPSAAVLRAASDNIRLQRGQKDRFREGVIRSGAYLSAIKQEFRREGLPEDLAYLAHVESSFNVQAYSKLGAAGIWQFTRSTGKRFMRVDYTVDERRDPFCATRAAALFLKENYERLGSWPLAITAYNHGANGMENALRSKGDYPTIFQEYDGHLFRFASRNFYSEFLAARRVAKNYRQYFGDLELEQPQQFYELKLDGFVPLADLVARLKVDQETIARLNPALRQPLFNGQKYVPAGYRLRLPARNGQMARLAARLPGRLFRDRQMPSRFYEVRPGDTAGDIARRHNVSLEKLILANRLDRRAIIYVGQDLRIPGAGEEEHMEVADEAPRPRAVAAAHPASAVAPSPERLATPAKVAPPAEVSAPPAEAPPVQVATAEVRVPDRAAAADGAGRAGDTSAPATGANAEAGTEQASTRPVVVNPLVVTGHLKVERVAGRGAQRYGVIRVEAGETLGHYAEWLGVRAHDLRRLNHLRFGITLRLNQQLRIPLAKVDRQRFEEQRFEYHKEIEEDFFAAYRIGEMRNYQIRKGDNIWVLSSDKFDVPFWLIRKYNADTDFASLRPNQQLVVPVVEKIDERLSSPAHRPAPAPAG